MYLYEQFADEMRLMERRIKEINEECDHIAFMLSMGGDDDE